MDDTNTPAPAGGEEIAIVNPTNADSDFSSVHSAAQDLANQRWKLNNPDKSKDDTAASADESAAEPQTDQPTETDADPPQEAPGETNETAEPAEELPPIAPPNSWTKEEKEEFASYPREAQEKIARREQQRESALRRGQNEAAEKLKNLSVREDAAEKARQQYEAALPALLQTLSDEMQGEFSDIKAISDLQKLAKDDPFRFAQYQAKQMQIAEIERQSKFAQDRQRQEYQQKWSEYATKEDQTFAEKVPEMADPDKARKLQDAAVSLLTEHGYSRQELEALWSNPVFRDHRMQQLILGNVRFKEAQLKAAKPAPKSVPPVQRPGTVGTKSSADAQIQSLERELNETDSPSRQIRIASEITRLRRANSRN